MSTSIAQWRENQSLTEHEEGRAADRPVRNINKREQWISVIGGGALLLYGVRKGGTMGIATLLAGGGLLYRGLKGNCKVYEALGIDTADHSESTVIPARQGLRVERAVTINRSAEELFEAWSKLENLPQIMQHLLRVETLDDKRSRWVAKGPLGKQIQWEAELLEFHSPRIISWRSLDGSDIDTAGSVRFTPLGHNRGTAVTVLLKYNPPLGKVGATIATLLGHGLEGSIEADLRRFKNKVESGEVPTTEGQPSGMTS